MAELPKVRPVMNHLGEAQAIRLVLCQSAHEPDAKVMSANDVWQDALQLADVLRHNLWDCSLRTWEGPAGWRAARSQRQGYGRHPLKFVVRASWRREGKADKKHPVFVESSSAWADKMVKLVV